MKEVFVPTAAIQSRTNLAMNSGPWSRRTFCEDKADAYFLSWRDCFQSLADNLRIGQSANLLHVGLLCHRHARHRIYYLVEASGIFILRVLHDAIDAPGTSERMTIVRCR